MALVELQKRLGDGEGRLKQQQALYEAVRADRNMYSKSLIEAQVSAWLQQCRYLAPVHSRSCHRGHMWCVRAYERQKQQTLTPSKC